MPTTVKQSFPDAENEALQRIQSMKIPLGEELTADLAFMSRYKYHEYEVYNTGKGFLQSLLMWLEQFDSNKERAEALVMVRWLLFISRREILELSHVTYQKILHVIMRKIIETEGLERFEYAKAYSRLGKFIEKNCVFIGMSDGAQIDYFRRHGTDIIQNDQVVTYYKLDEEERKRFREVKYAFLIDDTCLSGKTFLRREKRENRGALVRFLNKWKGIKFDSIYFCPYVISEKAHRRLDRLISGPRRIINQRPDFKFNILYGMSLPESYSILKPLRPENPLFGGNKNRLAIKRLCEKYYDPKVEDEHTMKGGGCRYGFGNCGILLVRYNNTPNNTPSLLWYDSEDGGPTKALFKRLARHHD